MVTVSFIGLGVMGYAMAGHLKKSRGVGVQVYNRTRAKAERWAQEFAADENASEVIASSPAAAARGAELVMMCLGNDDDVRSVCYADEGVLAGLGSDSILIDHTTASAVLARELSSKLGHSGFIDAPITGGREGAEKGILTVMCGGREEDFRRAEPALRSYARLCTRIGEVGSGQLTKMVNQICIAGAVQALAEGIEFGRRAGLDMEKVLAATTTGAAQSWLMERRGPSMARGELVRAFAIDWMRKDCGICLDEARRLGTTLPVVALVDQFFGVAQQSGLGQHDISSLIELLGEDNRSKKSPQKSSQENSQESHKKNLQKSHQENP